MARAHLREISTLSLKFVVESWRRNFMKRMSLDNEYDTTVTVEKVPDYGTSETSLLTFELSKTMRIIEELTERLNELEQKYRSV